MLSPSDEGGRAVNLVNWQGSAIFGTGSEWFWSMAQFVVVVVTLGGIYRQLRTQGAANALQRIDSLQGQWSSERLTYIRLALCLHLRYEGSGSTTYATALPLADFIENLYDLHEQGYISLREIAYSWGRSIQIYWAFLAPTIEQQRLEDGDPNIYLGFERLNTLLRQRDVKSGTRPLNLDPSTFPNVLDEVIRRNTEKLRLEQGWKSGVIPTAPATVPQERAVDPAAPQSRSRRSLSGHP
jgi:hypothetical protein